MKRSEIVNKMIEFGPDYSYITQSDGAWFLVWTENGKQQFEKIHGNSVNAIHNDHMITHEDSCFRLREDFYKAMTK